MEPISFFTFHLAYIFTSTSIYLASDVFTILRYVHVFHEDWLYKSLKWTDEIWYYITFLVIFAISFGSVLTASYEILPKYSQNTGDLMVYYNQNTTEYRPQILLNSGQIIYTIIIIILTGILHWQILSHLNTKFVNLPGITAQIRQKRRFQNKIHFWGSLLYQICRFLSVIPLCFACIQVVPNYKFYLITHFVSYTYESCGLSCFYLSMSSIFDKRNNKFWIIKIAERFRRKLRITRDTFEYNLDKVIDALLRSTVKPTIVMVEEIRQIHVTGPASKNFQVYPNVFKIHPIFQKIQSRRFKIR